MSDCCVHKTRHREPEERRALQNRLRRVEGQVRGLQKMLTEDAYCVDVLTQVSAVQAALSAFSRELLDSHIRTCVVRDMQNGDETAADELIHTIHKFMK